MSTIQTYCQECDKPCGNSYTYDVEFTGATTCWECVFKACNYCYGQGFTGWVSPDGDFDFDFCECNPLCLTLDEVR